MAAIADCLETIDEIGHAYELLFKENRGEKLQLVSSLNDKYFWVETLLDINGLKN